MTATQFILDDPRHGSEHGAGLAREAGRPADAPAEVDDRPGHWEAVYRTRRPEEVGWFQACPEVSLGLIDALGIGKDEPVIDVGGGASMLVDHLLARRFTRLTVLDLSATALAAAQARLGPRAQAVHWRVADITRDDPGGPYRVWHDRAAFHFLTEPAHRRRYVAALSRALAPGAHAIIGTFAEDGPTRCSDLPVCRYSPEALAAELGGGFFLAIALRERHRTPAGRDQSYVWCCFRRR